MLSGVYRESIFLLETDIQEYLNSKMSRISQLTSNVCGDPTLRDIIITAISEKCGSVFLLARLQLDYLANQTNRRNLRTALQTLPSTLSKTYEDALNRINAQLPERAALAMKLLAWVTYAKGPLEAEELRHAPTVEPGDISSDEEGLHLSNSSVMGRTEKGHEAMVMLLLEKGAGLDSQDQFGNTPLSWAVGNGHDAIAKLLLERGADPQSEGDSGSTPLMFTIAHGHDAIVKLLPEKGVDPESKGCFGYTPLLLAMECGQDAIVKLLLEREADPGSEGGAGHTPLDKSSIRSSFNA